MSKVLYDQTLAYLLDPLFQIENAIGKPVTGGYIIVKLAGTSTTYTTYSAFDGTQNPSKVPLDSSGRAVIIADNTQSYDVYVYDETDNLVTSRLSVVCIGSGTSSGAVYTATSPIQIINKNISHQGSGVTVGTYGDVSGNRQLNWGESFKVNTNSVNRTGHITNEFETVLTLPNLSELETNYFLGYYTGGSTFSTSAVTINFNKKDAQNISYSNGFIIPNNITLFDLSFNLYGYFQDRATATDGRYITISLYKDGTWIDSKEFYVNAYDQNIQINGNFKVKNQGNTYLLKANTDTGVFKLTQLIQVGIGSVIHVRINDETANQSINGSGSSEVYHTSSFTGNGNIDNPLTLVPASTTLLGGIKVGSNLSVTSDGTLNASSYSLPIATSASVGGIKVGSNLSISSDGTLNAEAAGTSTVQHDNSLTGEGTSSSPLCVTKATASQLGGIKVGSNLSVTSDGTLNATGGEDSYEVKVEASGTAGYLSDKIETIAPIQHRIDNDKVLIYQDPVEASPLMMLSTPSIDNVLSTLNVATNGTQQGSWIAIQAHAFTVPNYFVPTSTDIWNYVNINTQGSTAETVHFVGIYAYDLTTDEIHLVAMSVNGASHDNTSIGLAQLATGYVNTTSPYNIIKPGIIYYAFHACDQTALTVAGNTSNTFNLNRPYPSFILYNLRNGLTVNDFVTNYGTVSMTSSTISHQESSGKRFVSVRHIS